MNKNYITRLFASAVCLFLFAEFAMGLPAPPSGKQWVAVSSLTDEFDSWDSSKWHKPLWNYGEPVQMLDGNSGVTGGNLWIKATLDSGSARWFETSRVMSNTQISYPMYTECSMRTAHISAYNTFWLNNGDSDNRDEFDICENNSNPSITSQTYRPYTMYSQYFIVVGGDVERNAGDFDNRNLSSSNPLQGVKWNEAYHTLGAWWIDENNIQFYLDGEPAGSVTTTRDFTRSLNIIWDLWTIDATWSGGIANQADLLDDNINTMYVDWIHTYELVDEPDTDPPTPNPATWASVPSADSDTAISMTATTGSDASGPVEYYFDETSGNPGGTDSGWQTSSSYTDTGLTAETQYTYRVQMSDSLSNTGGWSSSESATTQAPDTDPPTPNPATFASAPAAISDVAISMTATTGSDASGPVEYYFDETSGNPGGTDSGWQTSASYTDTGLSASTQYTYTVQMRDSLLNTGTASAPASATTQAPSQDVEIIGSWISGTSHTAESGSNRCLVFTVHTEDDDTDMSASATYGGQTMTKVVERNHTSTGYRAYVAAFVLDEAGISAASGSTFNVSWAQTPSATPAYSSVFLRNVNQSAMTGAAANNGGTSGTIATTALATDDGDMVIVAGTCGISAEYTVNNGFSEMLELAPSSADGVVGYKSATGAGETPSLTHSSVNRQVIIGFVAQGASGSETDPPTPNPATWASEPNAVTESTISMTATTGSDASGPVEYYFDETSGNPGGTDSGWQTSPSYTDTGLTAGTEYTYRVQMRDSLANTGSWSTSESAVWDCAAKIAAGQQMDGDMSGPLGAPDCYVDEYDLDDLSEHWLNPDDFYDMAILAGQWRQCNDPQNANCTY